MSDIMNDLTERIDQLATIAGATMPNAQGEADSRRTAIEPDEAPPIGGRRVAQTFTGLPWWKQEGFFAATNYGANVFYGPERAPSALERTEWYQGARLGRSTLSLPYRRAQRRIKLANRAFLAGMIQSVGVAQGEAS